MLQDIYDWTESDIKIYEQEIEKLNLFIIKSYQSQKPIEINILTDLMKLNRISNCGAGINSFTLAPDGNIYTCPAIYFSDEKKSIGKLNEIDKLQHKSLLQMEKAFLCKECKSYQCKRCSYLNEKLTGEINIPGKIQCRISHIEQNKSRELQNKLIEYKLIGQENIIPYADYMDPLEKILEMKGEALHD